MFYIELQPIANWYETALNFKAIISVFFTFVCLTAFNTNLFRSGIYWLNTDGMLGLPDLFPCHDEGIPAGAETPDDAFVEVSHFLLLRLKDLKI